MKTTLFKQAFLGLALCLLITFSSCDRPQTEKVEKPETTITEEKATELSHRFVEEVTALMEGAKDTSRLKMSKAGYPSSQQADFKFASHAYYSVEQLERYFAWAKQEAAEKGYNLEGFRFYFGIYPDDENLGERQNFMTMFISPAGIKTGQQEGAMFKMPFTFYAAPEVIKEIDSDNLAGNGDPPHEAY